MSAKVPNLLVVAILALLTITSSRAAGCDKQLASYHDAGCPALADYTNYGKGCGADALRNLSEF